MSVRYLTFLTMFLFFSALPQAYGQINFDEGGYEQVIDRAKAANKPVFYMFYADWCPHCSKMKKEVFTHPDVITLINSHYIAAAQNVDKADAKALMQKYRIKSLPSFAFIDIDGTLLYSVTGEMDVKRLIAEVTDAGTKEKQLPYLKAAFLADQSNIDKCMAYIIAMKKGHERKYLSEAAHLYLATQKLEDLHQIPNWRIITNAVTDIGSREVQYILKNREKFEKATSVSRVETKLVSLASELLAPYVETGDTLAYSKHRVGAKNMQIRKVDSLLFAYDLHIYETVKDWKKFDKTVKEGAREFYWNNSKKLKETASIYLSSINDAPTLQTGIELVLRSLSIEESNDGLLLAAGLYQKSGDYDNTVQMAERARSFALSMGWEPKAADAILSSLKSR